MTDDNDQATVDRLCLLTYTSDQEGEPHDCVECADAARAIIDAIRKGEVPGVVTDDMIQTTKLMVYESAMEEIVALRDEGERLKVERDTASTDLVDQRDAEKARADKAEASNKLLIDELIPVGWEVLTSAGCPRCGCDVVAEPAMDGDGFVDGNPARCQSCGLPGQVTCDDDGAYFSADDNQWEIEEVAKRADRAAAERDRLAGLLRKIVENEPMAAAMRVFDRETYDAALAEVGK